MRETTVWIVRHAETENPHVFNGAETDVGLSELGHRQARAGGEWFRLRQPSIVVSSAMQRAVATARPIAELCHVPHRIEREFHERRVGDLAGSPFTQVEGPWAETLRRWQAGEIDYTTPGAESFAEIRHRVLTAWQRLLSELEGERIVLVAHGVVCKVLLLSLIDGFTPADWTRIGKALNLSVSELRGHAGRWTPQFLLQVPQPVSALTAQAANAPAGSQA